MEAADCISRRPPACGCSSKVSSYIKGLIHKGFHTQLAGCRLNIHDCLVRLHHEMTVGVTKFQLALMA